MPVIHGHFGPVSDLDWDTSKNILFTSSEDQTTRAFGYWKDNQTWNEINRPQIHGYNLRTISCLTENENEKDNYICKLVSGAEEKLIRVFTAPFNIISFTNYLTGVNINFSRDNDNAYYEKLYANLEGTKQALGLMNRMNVQDEEEDNNDYSNFEPDVLTNKEGRITSKINYYVPPDEDLLTNNTLWPEFNKLYGHGYELMAIATSHDGKFIASSGKAQSEKNAKLFIWTTENSKLSCKLEGHVLTIVQIEFSHNDEFILTVSRDRSWCVYKRNDTGTSYEMFQIEKEAHGRIIWGCSWSHDDSLFITGSRDKSIQLWKKNVGDQTNFTLAARKELKDSVTAVNFLPILLKDSYAFLVGYESGEIELMSYSNGEIKLMHTFHKFISHGSSVTRIKSIVNNSFNGVLVGTCSEDHSVRIFEIKL